MEDSPGAAWKRKIDENEFFYVVQDNYDEHAELSIPFYREMHMEMVRVLAACGISAPWRVLDLGSGTGKTSQAVLANFEVARLDAIDLFELMHEHASVRLREKGERIRFITADFMEHSFEGPFDVCVSALAIHHQNPAGKRHLFQKVHDALAPGGVFIMIDWTKFQSEFVSELAFQSARENLASRVPDAGVISNWEDHWRRKNIPDTVEDICVWLAQAGFTTPELAIRFWGMAMFVARIIQKP